MIFKMNMVLMECARRVYIAFSRFNGIADGRNCLFTCKRGLYKPPKLTVASCSIRSPATTATSIAATGRLKREDCRHIKLESAFSEWKILIGASDWKDHSMGKEGAEKYRTQNLPNCTSFPGVYELGIPVALPRPGREFRKLDSSSVVPVYFGQADNVRTRIQKYGRDGAHLENNGSSNNKFTSFSSLHGPALFSEIFSKGFPIVYRWAPMKSKLDAEKIEADLLGIYDYAWNKRCNGDRRPDDVRRKLEHCENKSKFSLVQMMLQYFNQKQPGNKIGTRNSFPYNSGASLDSGSGILSRIFTPRSLQPGRVQSDDSRQGRI